MPGSFCVSGRSLLLSLVFTRGHRVVSNLRDLRGGCFRFRCRVVVVVVVVVVSGVCRYIHTACVSF